MTSSLPAATKPTRSGAFRRNASPDRHRRPALSVAPRAQRCAIVVNIEAYATPVPMGLNSLNAIRNYATIADAFDAIFERIPCCAGHGAIAVTP
jgi:hypothetical protein